MSFNNIIKTEFQKNKNKLQYTVIIITNYVLIKYLKKLDNDNNDRLIFAISNKHDIKITYSNRIYAIRIVK